MRSLHSIFVVAALTGLVACAQNGAQSSQFPTSRSGDAFRVTVAHVRGLPASFATGITTHPRSLPPLLVAPRAGWRSGAAQAKNAHLMFVSSPNGNTVDIFPEYGKNVAPVGQITNGIDGPTGMAVDTAGNLYVANVNNNTVTVYPPGGSNPSVTYSNGLQFPIDVAVGNDGTVYVSCYFAGFVVEYPPGSTNPSLTITPPTGALPFGIALDSKNNLYVVYTTGVIYEYAPGSSNGTNLGITLPAGNTHGLAFDMTGDLLVSISNAPSGPSAIYVYPPGATQPSQTITSGVGQPFMLAFNRIARRIFLADFGKDGNGDGGVLEFRFPGGASLTEETQGVASAAYGVAITPPQPL